MHKIATVEERTEGKLEVIRLGLCIPSFTKLTALTILG